ncbi:MAG: hybrid sensor histidine kinase/response regulator [Bryobacteraceae bacterium]
MNGSTPASPERRRLSREEWLSETLHGASTGVIATSTAGLVEFVNPAAERLTGFSFAQAVGRPLWDVLRLEERPGYRIQTDLVRLATLHGTGIDLGQNITLISQTGEERDVEGEICVSESNGSIAGALVTIRDITRRKGDEQQHLQRHKIRAMARLAGGIAHDFNNVLTLILGYTDQLLEQMPRHDPLRQTVQQIGDAGNTAVMVTRQLLALARQEIVVLKPLDLSAVIEDFYPALRRALPTNIQLTANLAHNLRPILADSDQVQLMVQNLVLYAGRTMPGGGTIRVRTENVEVMPYARGRRIQRFIKLTVSDTGPGLDEDEAERLFEPSPSGNASQTATGGTELFIALSIVQTFNGRITVKSRPGLGTRFEILLPEEEAEQSAGVSADRNDIAADVKPTILLVEDDPDVRSLLHSYFQTSGYCVLEALNGEDALLIADVHEGAIDILITDVMMPGMSGLDLVRNIAELRPETKILFVSGYAHDLAGLDAFIEKGAAFLQKPFRQHELLTRVKSILHEGRRHVN